MNTSIRRYSVTLPKKLADKLDRLVEEEEYSITEITRDALREYFKKREASAKRTEASA